MSKQLFEYFMENRNDFFAYIRAIVGNTHEAEDIFQEVALAVVKKSEKVEEIRNYNAWIKQVIRNQLNNLFRKSSRKNSVYLPSEEMLDLLEKNCLNEKHSSGYMHDQYDALLGCMTNLKSNISEIIRRRFLEDESYREIADAMNMSEEAARKAALRARGRLADCVRAKLGEGA